MGSTNEWNAKNLNEYGEKEFIRQCNLSCNYLLYQERERRKIGREDLSHGILSKTSLELLETGKIGWTKLTGDILMYRMGVPADYFEVVSSAEDLERWRLREEICLLIYEYPLKAGEKLQEYQAKYSDMERMEEQFLKKAELLLLILSWKKEAGKDSEELGKILKLSGEAVECTIPGGVNREISRLWLSPAELEAVLLQAYAWMLGGRTEEARRLQEAVWKYPSIHQWEERMSALILPQAALLGMALALEKGDSRAAFHLGKEALELLRRNCSQRYLLPLLDALGRLAGRDQEEKEYLAKAEEFAECFRKIYREQNIPGYRLWQNVSVENTRDAGTVLWMLRQFEGKSQANAVYDGEERVVTPRQLIRIEKGQSKPSYRNYEKLLKQYGKNCGWKAAMLETESLEVLQARQDVSTLIGFGRWEDAEQKIKWIRSRVNDKYPRVRQELLFWDALYQWKREGDLEKAAEMLIKALSCTMPDAEGKHREWWVFQREETMIVSNIVGIYRKLGRMEEGRKWAEDVLHSMEQQSARTGIALTGYEILRGSYDSLLADSGFLQETLEMNYEAIGIYLKRQRIRCLSDIYYRIAWNSYEFASKNAQKQEIYRPIWREAYQVSEILAEFIYDFKHKAFLEEESRRKKFLI